MLLVLAVSTTYTLFLHLPITLRYPLQLILLLDSVRVRAPLGRIDQFLRQTLGNALDVAEAGLARADGQQGDGLIHAAQRRHVHGLAPYGASASNPG